MFGFVIGTLCFIGLIKVVRHGRGWGGGHRRWMLRQLYYRLDTTPGQEKLIEEQLQILRAKRTQLRSELRQTQADLSAAFVAESFDEGRMRSAFERHDRVIEELRAAALDSLKKVHEALRPEQRAEVAELFADPQSAWGHGRCGGGRSHGCGGYRRFGPAATVNL